MQKIKVLHIVGHFLPITSPWIKDQIDNSNIESKILSFTSNKCDERLISMGFNIFDNNILLYWMKLPLFLYKLMKSVELINKHFESDIIHVHFGVEGAYLSFLNRFFIRKKIIISFYGMDYKLVDALRYSIFFRIGKKYVHKYIVEGEYGRGELIKKGINSDKIQIVKIGVKNKPLLKKYFEGEFVRVTIATTFKEKKGVLYAAEALASLPNYIKNKIHLRIIGDGVLKNKFLKTIGMEFKYFFNEGYISREELYKRLLMTDIFLHPSIEVTGVDTEGGMPVVILEAAIAGCAIVSTEVCDIPMLIENKKSGLLVAEKSSRELCDALIEIINHKEKIMDLGREVNFKVSKYYSLDNMEKNILKVYSA